MTRFKMLSVFTVGLNVCVCVSFSQQKDFVGLSFPSISSVGPNGAIIHYRYAHTHTLHTHCTHTHTLHTHTAQSQLCHIELECS